MSVKKMYFLGRTCRLRWVMSVAIVPLLSCGGGDAEIDDNDQDSTEPPPVVSSKVTISGTVTVSGGSPSSVRVMAQDIFDYSILDISKTISSGIETDFFKDNRLYRFFVLEDTNKIISNFDFDLSSAVFEDTVRYITPGQLGLGVFSIVKDEIGRVSISGGEQAQLGDAFEIVTDLSTAYTEIDGRINTTFALPFLAVGSPSAFLESYLGRSASPESYNIRFRQDSSIMFRSMGSEVLLLEPGSVSRYPTSKALLSRKLFAVPTDHSISFEEISYRIQVGERFKANSRLHLNGEYLLEASSKIGVIIDNPPAVPAYVSGYENGVSTANSLTNIDFNATTVVGYQTNLEYTVGDLLLRLNKAVDTKSRHLASEVTIRMMYENAGFEGLAVLDENLVETYRTDHEYELGNNIYRYTRENLEISTSFSASASQNYVDVVLPQQLLFPLGLEFSRIRLEIEFLTDSYGTLNNFYLSQSAGK